MIFVSSFNTSFLLRNLAKNTCEFCLHNSCNSQSVTNLSLGRVTFLHAFLAHPGSLDRILRQDFPVALPADSFFLFFFQTLQCAYSSTTEPTGGCVRENTAAGTED